MKTVVTYGTFDLFHVGHVEMLRRARSLGDRLIVGCSTDEFNSAKGKQAIFKFEERAEILRSCRFVDHVFAEESWEQKVDDIKEKQVSIFTIGDDWLGQFDYLSEETSCVVTYLSRTPNISTTDVREVIQLLDREKMASVIHSVESLLGQLKEF